MDEVKILDSIEESKNPIFSIRQHYTENKANIENNFKAMTADQYKEYLDSINLPYIAIDKIIDYFISDGEKHEQEKGLRFNLIYNQLKNGHAKSKWEPTSSSSFVNNLVYFDYNDGLRVNLINDLIRISGPSPIFSNYSVFQKTISALQDLE